MGPHRNADGRPYLFPPACSYRWVVSVGCEGAGGSKRFQVDSSFSPWGQWNRGGLNWWLNRSGFMSSV